MPKKTLGVGMVGFGFIGKVHTYAYMTLPLFYDPAPARLKLVGVCSKPIADAQKGVEEIGYKFATEDYHDLLDCDDIDVINCCTPNNLHKDVVIDSLNAGKHVNCEKPLALNLTEAGEVLEVAQKSDRISQVTFEYRYIPAMMRAKQLLNEGFLGKIFNIRSCYLHSGYIDPTRPITWRLSKEVSGGGALYDLASHAIDLIRFLLGEYSRVSARLITFIKERPVAGKPGEFGRVEVDDMAQIQFEMVNGAIGTLEASRVATGANDELRLEVHGDKGAIKFNLMNPNWLEIYDVRDPDAPIGGLRGFKKIETVQRYPKPGGDFPSPKFSIGWMRYHVGSAFDFITNVVENRKPDADMYAGYKVQEFMEACQISDREGRWVDIPLDKY
ncbi:MAG: Gfo/Idh/MocA family oxidoreductase [Actinobacteria bacterium]|nr:Gfo/Idh/MocA family oxidoreductase [Actinomycetota bacterium]